MNKIKQFPTLLMFGLLHSSFLEHAAFTKTSTPAMSHPGTSPTPGL